VRQREREREREQKISAGVREFSVFQTVQTGSGAHAPSLKVKVKLFRYRPRQALGVPEG
jgi:hypothetical protein